MHQKNISIKLCNLKRAHPLIIQKDLSDFKKYFPIKSNSKKKKSYFQKEPSSSTRKVIKTFLSPTGLQSPIEYIKKSRDISFNCFSEHLNKNLSRDDSKKNNNNKSLYQRIILSKKRYKYYEDDEKEKIRTSNTSKSQSLFLPPKKNNVSDFNSNSSQIIKSKTNNFKTKNGKLINIFNKSVIEINNKKNNIFRKKKYKEKYKKGEMESIDDINTYIRFPKFKKVKKVSQSDKEENTKEGLCNLINHFRKSINNKDFLAIYDYEKNIKEKYLFFLQNQSLFLRANYIMNNIQESRGGKQNLRSSYDPLNK